MKKLSIVLLILPLITMAQETRGIKWTTGLSWEQIKQKAKIENKYIFLDCYTTWCGPCKMMDKNVFVDDSVGQFFSEKFIAVKVQIDKTAKDDENIKSWYTDAVAISKQYKIAAFPTFIFINPRGETTDIQTGYREPKSFLSLAQASTKPGMVYKDPEENYTRLLYDFNNGIVKYDSLDYMIRIANDFNDTISRPQLMIAYKKFMASLKPNARYTKKNVEFWSTLKLSSKSSLFQYILNDEKRVDKLMYKGFALSMIARTIQSELVVPFFVEENKNKSILMTGYYESGEGLKKDSSEADWEKLYAIIHKKYNATMAKRVVLLARMEWYIRHYNNEGLLNTWLIQLDKYPEDVGINWFTINNLAWASFESCSDKKVLFSYTQLMKVVVEVQKSPVIIDTYANLLYKIGKVKEAIEWEEKAMQLRPANKDYTVATEQMKKGEPTYGVQPLNN